MAGDVDFGAATRTAVGSRGFFAEAATFGRCFHARLDDGLTLWASGYDNIALFDLSDLIWRGEFNEFFATTFCSVSAERRKQTQH